MAINGTYYALLLRKLREAILKKRRGKIGRGIWLQEDNAPVHTCSTAMEAAAKCGFKLLPHPPYSPDLAPSDYWLFSNLNKEITWSLFHLQR